MSKCIKTFLNFMILNKSRENLKLNERDFFYKQYKEKKVENTN